MDEHVHHLIEVVADAWGRPRIRLHGEVAKRLDGHTLEVSLSHDGDYAIAYVVLSRPYLAECGLPGERGKPPVHEANSPGQVSACPEKSGAPPSPQACSALNR